MCSKNTLQVLLDETVRGLRDIFGERLDSVILYGSYARGDYDEESDIDVMALVKMNREELTGYRRRVNAFSNQLDLKHDVLLSIRLQDTGTFSQWEDALPFFKNVKKDGIRIDGAA